MKRFLFVVLCLGFMSQTAYGTRDHLDIVMLLDHFPSGGDFLLCRAGKLGIKNDNGTEDTALITLHLIHALEKKLAVIVSDHFVKNLMFFKSERCFDEDATRGLSEKYAKYVKELLAIPLDANEERLHRANFTDYFIHEYNVYVYRDILMSSHVPYVLLIPDGYVPHDYGLAVPNSQWVPVKKYDVRRSLMNLYNSEESLSESLYKLPDIQPLESLFEKNSEHPVKKRIFLAGHGQPQGGGVYKEGVIAGLELSAFRKFLVMAHTINTQFLFIRSCYAGDTVMNALEKEQDIFGGSFTKKFFDSTALPLTFIIAVGSIGNLPSSGTVNPAGNRGLKPTDLGAFFDKLNEYFRGASTLKDVIGTVNGEALVNATLVKYPGDQNFFRVADVGRDTLVLTFAWQQAKKMEKGRYAIDDKKAILVYPPIVEVPLETRRDKPVCINSMMHGDAEHILEAFYAPHMLLNDVAASFGGLLPARRVAYFLKNVRCILPESISQQVRASAQGEGAEGHRQITPLVPRSLYVAYDCSKRVNEDISTGGSTGATDVDLYALLFCKDPSGNIVAFSASPRAGSASAPSADFFKLHVNALRTGLFGRHDQDVTPFLFEDQTTVFAVADAINSQVIWSHYDSWDVSRMREGDVAEITRLKDTLVALYYKVMPSAKALMFASGGQQDDLMLGHAAVDGIFNSLIGR